MIAVVQCFVLVTETCWQTVQLLRSSFAPVWDFHWRSTCCFTDFTALAKTIKKTFFLFKTHCRPRKLPHCCGCSLPLLQRKAALDWIMRCALAQRQASRSPGDGKQVWKWTCSPSVPYSSLSSCNEEQWLYSWREGTPSDPPVLLLLLLLLPLPVYSDSAGKPTDDWAGSHLASVHLV